MDRGHTFLEICSWIFFFDSGVFHTVSAPNLQALSASDKSFESCRHEIYKVDNSRLSSSLTVRLTAGCKRVPSKGPREAP